MDSSNRITIDEKGFIKNLLRLGFTKNQSFSEILTNSIDAKSESNRFPSAKQSKVKNMIA